MQHSLASQSTSITTCMMTTLKTVSVASRDPVPTSFGRLGVREKLRLATALSACVPVALALCLLRRLFSSNNIPIKDDLLRSVIRGLFGVPLSITRKLLAPGTMHETLNSPRFSSNRQNLCVEVRQPGFCGWWINQGWGKTPLPPNKCDLVILFLHGGAYTLGHPLSSLTQQLRVSENLAARGITTSMLAVKYTLTPEAAFPTQFEETEAAYRYMIGEMAIEPSKIVFMGESAGGHLALATLYSAAQNNLPTPGGAFLLAPWVDLTNSDPCIKRNKTRDSLATAPLDLAVKQLVGKPDGSNKFSHLLNFASDQRPGLRLQQFLPSFVWVTAGSDEIFLGSIERFVANAQSAKINIELQVASGKNHGWQAFPDIMDQKNYLQCEPDKDIGDLMSGAANIADGMVEIVKRRSIADK